MYKHRAIGAFPTYATTESALHELHDSGFSMDRISVIGRDINQHSDLVGAHTSESMAQPQDLGASQTEAANGAVSGTVAGTTIGGLTGLLVGLGVVAIPGVGPIMLAGAAATAIATAISGSVIGAAAGSLVGGLIGLEIPDDRAKIYSDRVAKGGYLVVVEGSEADITLAGLIFAKRNVHDWYTYDLSVKPATGAVM
jgi:hypothetical protein